MPYLIKYCIFGLSFNNLLYFVKHNATCLIKLEEKLWYPKPNIPVLSKSVLLFVNVTTVSGNFEFDYCHFYPLFANDIQC